jgi:feruloyl-CoA synthase
VLVNAAPWSHSLGANAILHMVLHRGGTLYIDRGQPVAGRFGETLRNLAEISPTYHNMVPAGWALLADALERDEALARVFFARIRIMQNGGASQTQDLADRIQAAAVRAVGERITFGSGYGSTETGPTACTVHWPNTRAGLLGLPVAGTSIKLVPRDDKLELWVRGPQISPGYHDARAGGIQPLALDADGYCAMGDAVRLADPDRPEQGLAFDGRLSENFKLATGAFVTTGALRLAALSALGGVALDAVVCGEGQAGVGLMLFAAPAALEAHGEAGLRERAREALARHNAQAAGIGGRVARALILDGAPDPRGGEITDKGYINQALARSRRLAEIARLFHAEPDEGVIVL